MALEFKCRILERREMYRERTPEICRESPSSIQLSTDQHMHVRKLFKAGESKDESEEHSTHTETGIGLAPISQLDTLIIQLALGKVHSKVLLQD